jgi:Right handed beta helix region
MRPAYRSIFAVLFWSSCGIAPLSAAAVPVATAAQLLTAVNSAQPGDVITLAPGIYDFDQTLYCDTPGTAAQSITVQAPVLGLALIRFNTVEGFRISAPYWDFENLDIQGVCPSHTDCEHAFHVGGGGDFTRIRNSRLHDFNAMIKGNGDGTPHVFPNDVLIEGNELFDAVPRQTENPVTPIDVVGGRRWTIRGNFIHDYGKVLGDQISYAAFLKGNSRDGIFERNLVICERSNTGGIRLGLSFGGGGTVMGSVCEEGTCTPEHQNGIMRNNVIVSCPADVGIYLNKAQNARIYNNTLYNTTGIDVRFAASTADLRNNLLSGAIRNRDGGTSTQGSNRAGVTPAQWTAWFVSPAGGNFALLDGSQLVNLGQALPQVTDDYCGRLRDGAPDLGAVEYGALGICDTTRPGGGQEIFRDGFESGGMGGWLTGM